MENSKKMGDLKIKAKYEKMQETKNEKARK